MARPVKAALEYFPMDIGFFQDIKVRKLIRFQGGKAVTVYAALLCIIYRDGYYTKWDEDIAFVISEITNYEQSFIQEAVKCCVKVGLFNPDLYNSESILTSKGIQERYKHINKLCKRNISIDEYSCVEEFFHAEIERPTPSYANESIIGGIDAEIEELKQSSIWLEQLQMLHHLPKDTLISKLDDFKLQCLADGIEHHANIRDAKQHFNNWLRKIQYNNDKVRPETRSRRRGNILSSSEEKEYSNSF